jgi:hypothetical protein
MYGAPWSHHKALAQSYAVFSGAEAKKCRQVCDCRQRIADYFHSQNIPLNRSIFWFSCLEIMFGRARNGILPGMSPGLTGISSDGSDERRA